MWAILSNLKCCLLGCWTVALAAGLAAGCLAASSYASEESDQPYNVLMIIIDDAAPQLHSVGQGGPVRTPNIERIASRGTWFTQAYCNAPACNPSRTAMLTGVKASRSGVFYNSQKFPETWIAETESMPGNSRQSIASPVSLVDLYPTLVTLTGIDGPQHDLDGVDLAPLLAGEVRDRGRPVLSTWGRGNHAICDERYRYIRYRNGEEELYDHLADKHEWHNLAEHSQYASIKDRLARYLPGSDAPNTAKLDPPHSELEWDEQSFKSPSRN